MAYCRKCGTMLRDEKCSHCGADYKSDSIRDMKHQIKRNIKSRFNIPSAIKTVIVVVIVALIVLVCYLLFSTPAERSTFLNTAQPSINKSQDLIQSAAVQTQTLAESMEKPRLRVYHQMVNQLGLEAGCFGRVDGGVTNLGTSQARNVVVICSTDDGVSAEKDLGYIDILETKTFQILLNYECDRMHTEECYVNCDNC